MCLCTTVGNKLAQFYNLDVWNAATMIPGVTVPITPQPPPAVPLAGLVLTAMPPGCQMEIVTV
jgi:hypothetical protein